MTDSSPALPSTSLKCRVGRKRTNQTPAQNHLKTAQKTFLTWNGDAFPIFSTLPTSYWWSSLAIGGSIPRSWPGCHGDRTRLLSSATKMASSSEPLTVGNIRKIWKTEFLPNIKREIRNELKSEIEKVNCLITNLSKRLDSIASSQQLISDKYDSVLKSTQSTKKQINDLNNWCEAQDNKINHLNGSVYDAEAAIDSIQQYSRRDCLEISGIPI